MILARCHAHVLKALTTLALSGMLVGAQKRKASAVVS